MKRFLPLALAAIFTFGGCLSAEAAQPQQVTDAVMKVYKEELQKDPKNYNVLFRRAHLYYGMNKYNEALADITSAIEYTPQRDRDLLAQEYALRASVYQMLDRYADALPDIEQACNLDPESYAYLYQKANTEFELNNYAAAKEDYRKLGRMNSRSLESLVGLSRIAVRENNYALANEYIDRAVDLYPTTPEVYLRRARIRTLISNTSGAVDDLLTAYSLDPKSPKAINALVEMANKDYAAVISVLSTTISRNPNQGNLYFIRASIERAHYHYVAAIRDYRTLLDRRLYESAGVYGALADCYYALCMYPEATNEINFAIGYTAKNAPYFIEASRIRLANNEPEMALSKVERCLDKEPDNAAALAQKGLCQNAMGLYEDASNSFGEAILVAPNAPEYYILRAWVLADRMGRRDDANKILQRCIDLQPAEGLDGINTLRGFALAAKGDAEAARKWIDDIMAANPTDVDGRIAYRAACLYAWLADFDTAFSYMQKALSLGYANLYDWRQNDVANLNVAPLRSDLRFERLLTAFNHLFTVE